jgi:hypothetical protein
LICIADGAGNFRRFLVDMKPKTSAADPRGDLDKIVDDLDDLSIHGSATRTEESALGSSSPHAATSTHRSRRPRRPGSSSACAAMSACNSDDFVYFDFARTIGGLSLTVSITCLD